MLFSRFFVNKSTFARPTIRVLLFQMVQEHVPIGETLFAMVAVLITVEQHLVMLAFVDETNEQGLGLTFSKTRR